jgi:hypothetical protein
MSALVLNLFIPGVPKNSNARSQWAKYAAAKDRKKFRTDSERIAKDALEGTPWYPHPFTQIVARQISPVMRRRDPTGLAERLKGILDGLVDAGVLDDDDEDHIGITLAHSRKGPTAGIELTLFEAAKPSR